MVCELKAPPVALPPSPPAVRLPARPRLLVVLAALPPSAPALPPKPPVDDPWTALPPSPPPPPATIRRLSRLPGPDLGIVLMSEAPPPPAPATGSLVSSAVPPPLKPPTRPLAGQPTAISRTVPGVTLTVPVTCAPKPPEFGPAVSEPPGAPIATTCKEVTPSGTKKLSGAPVQVKLRVTGSALAADWLGSTAMETSAATATRTGLERARSNVAWVDFVMRASRPQTAP